MIGYKATDINGCCRGFKFEVGKSQGKILDKLVDILIKEIKNFKKK